MTADEFRTWRLAMGMLQEDAAAALGLSRRILQSYEAGTAAIPRVTAMAARALLDHPELEDPRVPAIPEHVWPPGSFFINLAERTATHSPTGARISFMTYRDANDPPAPQFLSRAPESMSAIERRALVDAAAASFRNAWAQARARGSAQSTVGGA